MFNDCSAPFFLILWVCWGPVPPLPSCIPIVYIPCKWRLRLFLHISWYLSWLLYMWTSHPQLVLHVMHEFVFLLPSAGELSVIFLPLKLHLEALNTFHHFLAFLVLCLCSHANWFLYHLLLCGFHLGLLVSHHIGIISPLLLVPCLHLHFGFLQYRYW